MGTPDFSVPALEALIKAGHNVAAVVTQPDAARDRGRKIVVTPVKQKALEFEIEVLQPEKIKKDTECINRIKELDPDVMIVIAYGQILSPEILEIPKYGCINIHASLLPRFRGAAPIQRAIQAGDKISGVTIMQMNEGLDTGDMLAREVTETGMKTGGELHDELSEMGGKLIVETLEKIEKGLITPEKQDDSLATYAHMLSKKEGKLDFSKNSAELERQIRAFDPWPGSFADVNGKTMKVWKAETISKNSESDSYSFGEVTDVSDRGIAVKTGDGELLLTVIQMPGKKRMNVKDFLRGNTIEKGTIIG